MHDLFAAVFPIATELILILLRSFELKANPPRNTNTSTSLLVLVLLLILVLDLISSDSDYVIS